MTELGEIPNEWEIIKLNECGYIFGGNAFKSSSFTTEYKENDYQVIRMGNVQLGKLDLEKNPVFLSENLVGEMEKKYLLKEADILISLTGTVNKTDYGNISWVDKNNKYLLNQRVGCLRNDNGEFNNRYYYYLLQSNMFRNQFFECGVGGTGNQANVSIADLNNIKVLKLPTREQEKIASILSTVDEQIDNFDALIEKNKELKKGLMQTLLTKGIGHTKFKTTEIGEIPEEWNIFKLSDCATIIDSLHETPEYSESGFPMIRVVDVNGKAINTKLTNKVCERIYKKFTKKYEPKQGDIIMSRVGSYGLVSYLKDSERVCLGQNIVIITTELCKKYLFYVLSSEYVKNNIEKVTVGSSQKTLSLANINELKILIPSIKEQNKISLILSDIDEKIEKYENKKQKLEELKKGLMQQLLSGQIRVNID